MANFLSTEVAPDEIGHPVSQRSLCWQGAVQRWGTGWISVEGSYTSDMELGMMLPPNTEATWSRPRDKEKSIAFLNFDLRGFEPTGFCKERRVLQRCTSHHLSLCLFLG